MQVCLRRKKYFSNPLKQTKLISLLDGEPLDENLLNLVDLSKQQRKDNVLQILKSNDFFCGFKTRTLEALGNRGNVDYKEQIKILIGSIGQSQSKKNH